MFYTYILYFDSRNEFYTGYSSDLRRRIAEHKRGGVASTKHKGNFSLIFYECFADKRDAHRREEYFKTTKGKRTLRLMLKYSIKRVE